MRKPPVFQCLFAVAAIGVAVGCGPGKTSKSPAQPPLESYFPLANATDAELCAALATPPPPVGGDPAVVRRKVVISDLHLGPGHGQGQKFDGLEDFFADEPFGRVLRRLATQPTELIIAGDFIEFWQIEEALGILPKRRGDGPVLATDQRGSLAAFDVALAAHPTVFTDLGEFLSVGDNRVVFVVGNHDGDLMWPRVQIAIARALGQKDISRLSFVPGTYIDRGVSVAHGHLLDAANKAGRAVLDEDGRCRLAASWGQVFVAKFLGSLEQRYPFIDNLYPESSALLWGVSDEPDVFEPLIAGYNFIDMLIGEQSGALNLEALRASVLSVFGAPDSEDATPETEGDWARVWDRMPGSESLWSALTLLATDPELTPLRDGLIAAVVALPDIAAAGAILSGLETSLLGRFKDKLTSDPLEVAATEMIARNPSLRIVVYAHTHVPGGSVAEIEGGHYANTGTWTPIGKISRLKSSGADWTELDIENASQFPRRLPAVVIDYVGEEPRPPHVVSAN